MSAKWPSAVATDADLYTAVNLLQTTLSGNINNSTTTVGLTSTTGFPTAGAVTIDNEVIFYTGVSGSNLTGCTRGADGTSAASHNSGVPVGATIVAFHHNGLMAEIEAIETDLNARFGFGSTSIVVPSSVAFTLAATTNQAILGTTRTVTINAPTPATSSRTWTIPDITGNGTFAALEGTQTFSGAKTFSTEPLAQVSSAGAIASALELSNPNNTASTGTQLELTLRSQRDYKWRIAAQATVGTPSALDPKFLISVDDGAGTYTDALTILSSTNATLAGTLTLKATSNQLAFGTTNVTTISSTAPSTNRTYTIPDAGGNANIVIDKGAYTLAGQITMSNTSGNPIHGNSASPAVVAAGNVGEIISAVVTTSTNFPTSGQFGDLTSISLTAGVWLISLQMAQQQNGATVATVNLGVSTTSGNSGSGLSDGNNYIGFAAYNSASGEGSASIPFYAVTPSSTTTYYLKFIASYTVATPQAVGRITALRIG